MSENSRASISFGHPQAFNPDSETIAAYLECVELFLQANAVAEEKKVTVFLSVIGRSTYSLLRNLTSPTLQYFQGFDG